MDDPAGAPSVASSHDVHSSSSPPPALHRQKSLHRAQSILSTNAVKMWNVPTVCHHQFQHPSSSGATTSAPPADHNESPLSGPHAHDGADGVTHHAAAASSSPGTQQTEPQPLPRGQSPLAASLGEGSPASQPPMMHLAEIASSSSSPQMEADRNGMSMTSLSTISYGVVHANLAVNPRSLVMGAEEEDPSSSSHVAPTDGSEEPAVASSEEQPQRVASAPRSVAKAPTPTFSDPSDAVEPSAPSPTNHSPLRRRKSLASFYTRVKENYLMAIERGDIRFFKKRDEGGAAAEDKKEPQDGSSDSSGTPKRNQTTEVKANEESDEDDDQMGATERLLNEGDPELHQEHNLRKRAQLRHDVELKALLDKMWSLIPKVSPCTAAVRASEEEFAGRSLLAIKDSIPVTLPATYINWNMYRLVSAFVFRRLVPDGSSSSFQQYAYQDWLEYARPVPLTLSFAETLQRQEQQQQQKSAEEGEAFVKTLMDDANDNRATTSATADTSAEEGLLMTEEQFCASMFAIADVWTLTIDAMEYETFMTTVLTKGAAQKVKAVDPYVYVDVRQAVFKEADSAPALVLPGSVQGGKKSSKTAISSSSGKPTAPQPLSGSLKSHQSPGTKGLIPASPGASSSNNSKAKANNNSSSVSGKLGSSARDSSSVSALESSARSTDANSKPPRTPLSPGKQATTSKSPSTVAQGGSNSKSQSEPNPAADHLVNAAPRLPDDAPIHRDGAAVSESVEDTVDRLAVVADSDEMVCTPKPNPLMESSRVSSAALPVAIPLQGTQPPPPQGAPAQQAQQPLVIPYSKEPPLQRQDTNLIVKEAQPVDAGSGFTLYLPTVSIAHKVAKGRKLNRFAPAPQGNEASSSTAEQRQQQQNSAASGSEHGSKSPLPSPSGKAQAMHHSARGPPPVLFPHVPKQPAYVTARKQFRTECGEVIASHVLDHTRAREQHQQNEKKKKTSTDESVALIGDATQPSKGNPTASSASEQAVTIPDAGTARKVLASANSAASRGSSAPVEGVPKPPSHRRQSTIVVRSPKHAAPAAAEAVEEDGTDSCETGGIPEARSEVSFQNPSPAEGNLIERELDDEEQQGAPRASRPTPPPAADSESDSNTALIVAEETQQEASPVNDNSNNNKAEGQSGASAAAAPGAALSLTGNARLGFPDSARGAMPPGALRQVRQMSPRIVPKTCEAKLVVVRPLPPAPKLSNATTASIPNLQRVPKNRVEIIPYESYDRPFVDHRLADSQLPLGSMAGGPPMKKEIVSVIRQEAEALPNKPGQALEAVVCARPLEYPRSMQSLALGALTVPQLVSALPSTAARAVQKSETQFANSFHGASRFERKASNLRQSEVRRLHNEVVKTMTAPKPTTTTTNFGSSSARASSIFGGFVGGSQSSFSTSPPSHALMVSNGGGRSGGGGAGDLLKSHSISFAASTISAAPPAAVVAPVVAVEEPVHPMLALSLAVARKTLMDDLRDHPPTSSTASVASPVISPRLMLKAGGGGGGGSHHSGPDFATATVESPKTSTNSLPAMLEPTVTTSSSSVGPSIDGTRLNRKARHQRDNDLATLEATRQRALQLWQQHTTTQHGSTVNTQKALPVLTVRSSGGGVDLHQVDPLLASQQCPPMTDKVYHSVAELFSDPPSLSGGDSATSHSGGGVQAALYQKLKQFEQQTPEFGVVHAQQRASHAAEAAELYEKELRRLDRENTRQEKEAHQELLEVMEQTAKRRDYAFSQLTKR